MTELLLYILIVTALVNAVLLIVLLVRQNKMARMHDPKDDDVYRVSRQRANAIIHKAVDQANKLIKDTQGHSEELLGSQKEHGDTLNQQYEGALAKLSEELAGKLAESETKAEKAYEELFTKLQEAISSNVDKSQGILDQKADEAMAKTREELSGVISGIKDKISGQIDEEMASIREASEEYKKRRMQVVDEHIVEILEKTLAKTMSKSLSLSDHVDFAYKSLEEAKREQFFTE